MPFRLDLAVRALQRTMETLAGSWEKVDDRAQRDIGALILHYGARIVEQDAANIASTARAFLDELWLLRDQLPREVVGVMVPAQGVSRTILAPASEEERRLLVSSLLRVADVRQYADPTHTAEQVSLEIYRHQSRLLDEERESWQLLRMVYETDGDAVAYLRGIEALLGQYPLIRKRLEAGKTWRVYRMHSLPASVRPEGSRASGDAPAGEESSPAGGPDEIVRYANVHFPSTVLVSQQVVPLVIHLARDVAANSVVRVGDATLSVQAGELTLVLHAEGFRLVNTVGGIPVAGAPAVRRVHVEADRDAEPVVFLLSPLSTGTRHICIDVYQGDRNVGALGFDTTVVEHATAGPLASIAVSGVPILAPGAEAEPPDLELRVTLSGDRRVLSYTLHTPDRADYHFKPVGQRDLGSDPRDFLERDLERLNSLARTSQRTRGIEESRRAAQEIANMGIRLYDSLFPAEFKAEYRRLRTRYANKTLLITSDEPWIPWELVKPYESDADGEVLYDDPHWCEMFRISRWLAGRGPRDRITLKTGALVLPPDNLQAARQELEYFAALHRARWELSLAEPPLTTLAEVEDSFREGRTHLFHFACHGNFDTQDADESKLKLADGFLRASQIVGDARVGLQRARPVVFLNACHSGQSGFTFTRLGGWAQRFIESGASVFMGSLWEIQDDLAARFATELYNRLWGLQGCERLALGEAFYQARMTIKALDPSNPTWLAYVLYGDPKATVTLGSQA